MPELPEVETVKRELVSLLIGRKITKTEILWPGVLNILPKKFGETVRGARVNKIERRAKILIFTLSNGFSLLMHLKMTGQLIYVPSVSAREIKVYLKNSPYRHVRFILFFSGGGALVFNDTRKFGYLKLVFSRDLPEMIGPAKLGPEPLDKDFTIDKFKDILSKYRQRKIKQVLTDQSAIAGLGNIYADEVCFYAKVLPSRRVSELSPLQVRRLYLGIKKILPRAIELRGTSVDTYVNTSGRQGRYARELRVYGRKGKECPKCGKAIERVKIAGRSSYFCPACQT